MKNLSIATAICLLAITGFGQATVPRLMDYQGVLKDGAGDPVADGSYSVTFTIYDDPVAGSSKWAETQSVNTTNGLFAIQLGAVNPIHDSVFADTMRYLGITVSPDPEMTPRARLVTVPYAFRAATIDGASGGELSSSVWWTEELSTFDDEPMMYLFNPSPAGPVDRKIIMRSPTEPNFGLFYNTSSESFQFKIGSSILTIAMGAGRVGVGTDNPASEMDIVGTLRAQGVEMGLNPTRSGNNSTVGGGSQNSATANWATAAGGFSNTASGENATVSGGNSNSAAGIFSAVGGGSVNSASGLASFIGGGTGNDATATKSTIGGGNGNNANGAWSVIGGGTLNTTNYDGSFVGGGQKNSADTAYSAITGGIFNNASGHAASIGGGYADSASGEFSTIGGGKYNQATDTASTVSGGQYNSASVYGTIGGGTENFAGYRATVSGGKQNYAGGTHSSVGGGTLDSAYGDASRIGGGHHNIASQFGSVVSGGAGNAATGEGSTIGGGTFNSATSSKSTIGGGYTNQASGGISTIGGGDQNTSSGSRSTIGGGYLNSATASYSTVGGGDENVASGTHSTVPGGVLNVAAGNASVAMGQRASALHSGSFVWSDNDDASPFETTGDLQFLIDAGGGVGINTNTPSAELTIQSTTSRPGLFLNGGAQDIACGTGQALQFGNWDSGTTTFTEWVRMQPGGVGIYTTTPSAELHVNGDICYTGTIGACSDIRYKTDIAPLSGSLDRIMRLRGVSYRWKQDEFPNQRFDDNRHTGLIAQEVEALFPDMVMTDDNGYKSVDYSRLTPVLVEAVKTQQEQIDELKRMVQQLADRLSAGEAAYGMK